MPGDNKPPSLPPSLTPCDALADDQSLFSAVKKPQKIFINIACNDFLYKSKDQRYLSYLKN